MKNSRCHLIFAGFGALVLLPTLPSFFGILGKSPFFLYGKTLQSAHAYVDSILAIAKAKILHLAQIYTEPISNCQQTILLTAYERYFIRFVPFNLCSRCASLLENVFLLKNAKQVSS